jgi:glycerol-3-phosphate O-acyltransferase/dihydroxyacetone phosphate acyltransferase
MALGALAANPDCGVKIVPCGMNYFHAHKFRSRAVIEFGSPIEVPEKLVELYKNGERREAVSKLLDTIYQSLVAVTVTSPDYDTLMMIQAARRLYNPPHKRLPLPMVVELNRRLVKGYETYKEDDRIKHMKQSVLDYNRQLRSLGLRDHQVDYAKYSSFKVILTFMYRTGKLLLLTAGALPGLVLFAPVFVAGKLISIKKSKEALAASTVKIQAKDVVATWKLLVALVFAPILYTFYITLFTIWTSRSRVGGTVPEWIPLWLVVVLGWIIFPTITFAALRIGEVGMDIFKSLRPLILSLSPSSANTLVKLRERRQKLAAEVTDIINTLGPEVFKDFESSRIIMNPFQADSQASHSKHQRDDSVQSQQSVSGLSSPEQIGSPTSSYGIPRNESFTNLAHVGLFSTHPPSRSRSRSRSRSSSSSNLAGSDGMPLRKFSTLDSQEDYDEVSKRIRSAMSERGKERASRRSRSFGESEWEFASGSQSPELKKEK